MKRIGRVGLLGIALALLFEPAARATHFRGAVFAWHRDPSVGPYGVSFTIPYTVRRSGYSGTDVDGYPAVGDKVYEAIGSPYLDFGDNHEAGPLYLHVIAIDKINDTMTGNLEEFTATPPNQIKHSYAGPGPFTAFIATCCRVSTDPLNGDGNYRLETIVSPGSPNHCPITNFVSNVDVERGTSPGFILLASDPDGDPINYRLATPVESGLKPVPGVSVNATTGLIKWTVPANLTVGPYGNQIIVEDALCKVPVDFTITVRSSSGGNHQPTFVSPSPCGETLPGNVSSPLAFTVKASDPDVANTVTLNNSGLPVGASFVASPANPTTGAFSWTPGKAYKNTQQIMVFTASDGSLSATPCSLGLNIGPSLTGPTITGINPASGPSIGGQSVTITGTNFKSGAVAQIGALACDVTSLSATSITCTTPPGPPGPVDVSVTNLDGESETLTNAYTYVCPAITPAASVSGASSICAGDSTQLSVALTGASPWTLYWSDGVKETNITTTPHLRAVSPPSTTLYGVTVVSDSACAAAGTGGALVTVNVVQSNMRTAPGHCPGGPANASVPDAGPGATYAWSITNGNITGGNGTKAITYTAGSLGTLHLAVTVTASDSCTSSSGVDIPVEPPSTAQLDGTATMCAGGTTPLQVSLTGIPPWSVSFSDGFTAADVDDSPLVRLVSPASNTVYTITSVSDAKLCAGTITGVASITVQPSPSAALTAPASLCHDSTLNAASVPNAGPGATYLWTIGNGVLTSGQGTRAVTFSVGSAAPVPIGVTVTGSNGCSSSNAFDLPMAPALTATVTGTPTTVCYGSSVTLHATLTGTPPFHVTWSDGFPQTSTLGAISHMVTPTSSQTYTITSVTDASACPGGTAGSLAVTVTTPPSAISALDTTCPGSTTNTASVADAGPGATYEWVVSGGTIVSGNGTPSIVYSAGAGPALSIFAKVTVPPGCVANRTKNVTVAMPGASVIGNSTLFAAPSADIQVALNGAPPWTLTWSDGFVQSAIQTNPTKRTVTPLRTTTYTLTSVGNGSCTTPATGTVQVIPQGVGDVDANGTINVLDVFYLINYLFANGPAPLRSGDVNKDNSVSVLDVFYLINYLFAGGPAI